MGHPLYKISTTTNDHDDDDDDDHDENCQLKVRNVFIQIQETPAVLVQ